MSTMCRQQSKGYGMRTTTSFNQFVLDVYLLHNDSSPYRKMAVDLAHCLRGITMGSITPEFRGEVRKHMRWEKLEYPLDSLINLYDDILACAVKHRYLRANQTRH